MNLTRDNILTAIVCLLILSLAGVGLFIKLMPSAGAGKDIEVVNNESR